GRYAAGSGEGARRRRAERASNLQRDRPQPALRRPAGDTAVGTVDQSPDLRAGGHRPVPAWHRASGPAGWSRVDGLLAPGRTRSGASAARRAADSPPAVGIVLSRALRPLHDEVAEPGRRGDRLREAHGPRDLRQRASDGRREEQPRDRGSDRAVAGADFGPRPQETEEAARNQGIGGEAGARRAGRLLRRRRL